VKAFASPKFEGGSDPSGPYLKHGDLKYALDFERAFEVALAENKPLFLDFTGVNCTNCRFMEDGTMSQPMVEDRLKQFVRIQLFVDSVPIDDKVEAERLKEFNQRLQQGWFGRVALPSYVVIPPDRLVLTDSSRILDFFEGVGKEAEFAAFLDRGLNKWQKLAALRGAKMVGQR
jgi:thiol:disulfide interchange protein DsbD